MDLTDFVPAGNQGSDPGLYEIENGAMDRTGRLWRELASIAPWKDRTLLDLGCGSGFWLPRYAEAAEVVGVEPDPRLLQLAKSRPRGSRVLYGSAENNPLPDEVVDVAHARFAYFFPTADFDPTPGLIEVGRVLKATGKLVVIDNDTERGEFASLLKASPWAATQGQDNYARQWWARKGASTTHVMSSWEFDSRADLEAVLHLEFPYDVAEAWLHTHPGRTHLSYGYLLHVWSKS